MDRLVEEADIRQAQATVPEDLDMIQGRIKETLGYDEFNAEVREKLMAHLVCCSVHAPPSTRRERGTARYVPEAGPARRGAWT